MSIEKSRRSNSAAGSIHGTPLEFCASASVLLCAHPSLGRFHAAAVHAGLRCCYLPMAFLQSRVGAQFQAVLPPRVAGYAPKPESEYMELQWQPEPSDRGEPCCYQRLSYPVVPWFVCSCVQSRLQIPSAVVIFRHLCGGQVAPSALVHPRSPLCQTATT